MSEKNGRSIDTQNGHSVQNVTPVRLVVCSPAGTSESRGNGLSSDFSHVKGLHIRWGMHKPHVRPHHHGLVNLIGGIKLYKLGKRRTPGFTAKGVKWAILASQVEEAEA